MLRCFFFALLWSVMVVKVNGDLSISVKLPCCVICTRKLLQFERKINTVLAIYQKDYYCIIPSLIFKYLLGSIFGNKSLRCIEYVSLRNSPMPTRSEKKQARRNISRFVLYIGILEWMKRGRKYWAFNKHYPSQLVILETEKDSKWMYLFK